MRPQARTVVAVIVVAALLVLIASFGIGSRPNNSIAEKAASPTSNTLVGGLLVVAGAALGFAGNYWIETRRWKREDRTHFRADKLHLYRDFLSDIYFAANIRFYYAREEEIDLALAEIRLVSSDTLSNVAEELSLATQRWCETGAAAFKGDPEERRRAFERAKEAFYRATRAELGIPEKHPQA